MNMAETNLSFCRPKFNRARFFCEKFSTLVQLAGLIAEKASTVLHWITALIIGPPRNTHFELFRHFEKALAI